MSKNDIYAILKDDETARGVKPLAKPSATVTPQAAAPAATVTPTDTKTTVTPSEPVTPLEEKEETGTPSVSVSGGAASNQTPRYNTEAESKLSRELAYNGVLYERMKKYMPLQQKRAGMGNMGIAQTGLAQITNDHMNRRSDILSLYQEEIANASLANSGTDEKTKAAIAAFKDSISSYGSAEEANAGLDALGLEATDPQYIALKTIISGYFRDKADNQTQANIDAFMENLDIHGDAETAVAAFKNTLSKDDPRFSQYETQIHGYFTNKTSTETKRIADQAFTTLYDILSSDATKEEINKIWNEHAHIIPTMTADQQATLKSLYSVSGMPTKTELAANAISMRDEVDALIAEGATTDEIDTTLAGWKGKVTEDEYNKYFGEVEKAKKSEEYLLAAAKARGTNGINYANEIILQEGANKYTNGDVDAYIEDVLAGNIDVKDGVKIKSDKPLNNHFLERPVFADAFKEQQPQFDSPFDKNIPNGTVVWTDDTGKGFSYEDLALMDYSNPYNLIPGVAAYNWIAEMGTLPKWSNKKDAYVYFDGAWYPAKVKK